MAPRSAPDGGPRRPWWTGRRGSAVLGGSLVSLVVLGTDVARQGRVDLVLLGLMLAAIVGGALLVRGRQPRGRRTGGPSVAEQRPDSAAAVLAQFPYPVIVTDRHVVVLDANPAAHALLPALKLREPLSFALRDPDVLQAIAGVLRTGEPATVETLRRSSPERVFEVQIAPIEVGGSQGPPSVVLFFRDLTAARLVEHMRVDFVANASHELRTPLASLLGFIETLQGPARNDPKARARFLEIMREQASRMARLIDDLLSLSRIELRAHMQPDTPVDLRLVADSVLDALGPLGRERGVDIVLGPGETPCIVRGDRDELVRVVENLVENALKYGESGGRVEVSLARRTDAAEGPATIELSVRDFGPGIALEHLPRLTERFYRVDVVESRKKGGTGLGLAIVKHILARHRGRLTIESEPGRGALFRVALPEHPSRRAGCHAPVIEPS